jgi:hypothetical protein
MVSHPLCITSHPFQIMFSLLNTMFMIQKVLEREHLKSFGERKKYDIFVRWGGGGGLMPSPLGAVLIFFVPLAFWAKVFVFPG